MARAPERRQFGQITRLPSGRYRARYADPDGRETPNGEPLRHNAPHTFESKDDAEAWLVDERRMITAGSWAPPSSRRASNLTPSLTVGDYAPRWLAGRKVQGRPLAERTRDHYQDLLDRFILPTFADVALKDVTQPAGTAEPLGWWSDRRAP